MSVENQYDVIFYLKGFHRVEVGQGLADCKFGFKQERGQFFISKTETAENIQEGKRKGELRIKQVLNVFMLHTGVTYDIDGIFVNQISGKKPFMSTSTLTIRRINYLPISKEKMEEIERTVLLLDKLQPREHTTEKVDKAINYFLQGCHLESQWHAESFLNFYKVIELISNDFRDDFSRTVSTQLKESLLKELTKKEMEVLLTPKRLIQFTCGKLRMENAYDVSKIIELRNKFGAHAGLKEVVVSSEEFNSCKFLAQEIIMKYINHIQAIGK